MGKKIYFSPSDQVNNRYAAGDTNEAAQCRAIALAAVEAAKRCGFEAMTDTQDGSEAMYARVRQSNDWGADAHIPIHTNAFNGQVQGTRMFCYDNTGSGYGLCKAIFPEVCAITPGQSDSISVHQYYEVKYAAAPTAYLEVGFHDNPEEASWIIAHTKQIAEAIVKGVCAYFGAAYVEPEGEKTPEPKTETLYRVRQTWSDAASQIGAYRSLENAKRACKAGYTVYDEAGQAVYTPEEGYTLTAFIREVQQACGARVDGVAGPETLSKTVTLSAVKNAAHKAVKPVQKRLAALGYTQVGAADGIAGKKFTAAVTAYQKENGCVADGEITAGNRTWKKLLGMA